MPVVPVREPSQVTTRVGATAQTSPVDKLAAGLESFSSNVGSVGLDIQMRENADRVMQAEITLRDAEREHRNSVNERKGVDAFGVTQESEKWWAEKTQEISDSLGNEAQQLLFSDLAEQRRQVSLDTISGYEAAERRNSFNKSSASIIDGAIQAAAESPYNPAVTELERERIKETVADLADSNGWTSEIVEAELAEKITSLHAGVIDALMADSPPAAEAYFKEHRKEISGKERATIDALITARMIDHKAMQLADRYYADEDSYDEANKKADKISDPDLRKATRAAIRTQYADDVWGRQANEGLAGEEAWKVIADEGTVQDVKDQGIWDRMSGSDRLYLLRWQAQIDKNKIAGDVKVDDLALLTEVEQQIEANFIREEKDLQKYYPFFQEATRERLRKKVRENTTLNFEELRKAFEARIGYKRDVVGKNAWKQKHWDQWARVENYARNRVAAGAQASDVGAMIDELYLEGEMSDASFWVNDPNTMGEAIKEPGRADRFTFDAPDAHVAALSALATDLKTTPDQLYTRGGRDAISILVKLGEPVTANNILYIMEQMNAD